MAWAQMQIITDAVPVDKPSIDKISSIFLHNIINTQQQQQ